MADTSKDELLLDGGITASHLHRAEVNKFTADATPGYFEDK